MTNNKIGVTLDFKANTSQAKQAMQQLQHSLAQISSKGTLDLQFQKAAQAARELSFHLNNAYNTDTGKLNLGKLTNSLNSSKQNLSALSKELLSTGEIGRQAFVSLAQSVSLAEPAVFKLQGVVGKLWLSLKNVASWQISAGILQGLISGLSEAYQFAQDLNESLNNIRIVTGYSKEEMDAFAKSANKAAKALSATTTAMTDASLIYFQQGLSMQEAQKRAEITIKLANVTGEAVSTVSDQLTAVWNNFYDGSQSLEYYVDILTALGAATASSTDEITNGLEKFAAIAETVGLSYEYAASALATVTATTRQSADVVGTAFKTLFARIQDLELGETLDDGTTMGQYSQALAAVGINIKDINGEIKNMNIILDEMGAKWNTLNKDTQIALAQNVAGVRQYTQLMALMDNWSFFQENLNTSLEATGELNKQHEIYAEGWKAAADRVTAALEDIYQDILDDDFFIDILNMIEEILGGIDSFIEKIGGIGPIISGIMGMITIGLSSKITPMVNNLILSFQTLTPNGAAKAAREQTQPLQDIIQTQIKSGNYSQSEVESLKNSSLMIEKRQQYFQISKNLTEEEKRQAELQFTKLEEMQSHNVLLVQNLEQLETKYNDITTKLDDELAGQTNIVDSLALQKEYLEQNEERERRRNELIEERKKLLKMEKAEESYNKNTSQIESSQIKVSGLENQKAIEELKEENIKAQMESVEDNSERLRLERELIAIEEKKLKIETDISLEKEKQKKLQEEQQRALATMGVAPAEGNVPGNIRDAVEAQENKVYQKNRDLVNEQIEAANGSKQVSKVLEELIQKYKTLAQQTATNAKTSKDFKGALESLKTSKINFKEILNGEALSAEAQQIIQNILGIDVSAEGAEIEVQQMVAKLKELGVTGPQIAKIEAELNKAAKAADNVEKEVNETNVALAKGRDNAKGFADSINPQHSVGALENITKLAGGISSLTFGIQGATTAFASLGDESLSAGEKATSAITGMSMAIPSLISGGKALISVFQAIAVATGLSLGAVLGIGAAIAAVVVGIIWFTSNLEKEKTALEKATEAAKNQQKALESITEATKEMSNALQEAKDLIASYSEVSNAFDGLIEGSTAYIENLQKEIELVSELLEKYPELMDMGIIGMKDGRYQVLDEALLQQYVVGTSTVDMLNMDIGKAYKSKDSAIANEELRYKNERHDAIVERGQSSQYEISVGRDGQSLVLEAFGKTFSTQIANQNMTPGFADEFAGYVNKLKNGASVSEIKEQHSDTMNTELFNLLEDYAKEYEKYNNQLNEINDEHLNRLKGINRRYEQQYLVLASQVLSYQKGFSALNQYQQAAVTKQTADALEAAQTSFETGVDTNFSKELGDYIIKATGQDVATDKMWSAVRGKGNDYDDNLTDIGDFFVNTEEGTEAAAAYLRDVKGIDITRDEMNAGGYSFDTTGMKSGEGAAHDIDLDWAEVAAYYAGQMAYESIDYEEFMRQSKLRSDATNAMISKTVSSLSEADMAKIATGDRDSGFKLKRNSAELQEAAAVLGLEKGSDEYNQWLADITEQVEHYDAALAETLLKQQELQKGNQYIAEAAEKYGLDAEVIENYAKSIQKMDKAQTISYESAAKLAVANARLSRGVENLRKNWLESARVLNTVTKGSYEWIEAATEIANNLSEMFGVDVSTDFVDKYQDKIAVLVEGGDEAVKVFQELELVAGKEYVASLSIDQQYKNEFTQMLKDLTAQEDLGMTVGIKGEIDQSYIDSINKLLESGAMTADEVNAMFNSIGWDPNITTKQGEPVSTEQVQHIISAKDEDFSQVTEDSWQKIVTTVTPQVPVIGDVTSAPKSTSSVKTNTTSGGSGSKKQKKTKNDEVERYHEIKEELSDLQRAYDNVSKAKDRAFGKTKLEYLKQEQKITEDLIDAQERYIKEIEGNLATDTKALEQYGATIGPDGRLLNYDKMYEANMKQYNDAVDAWNAGKMSDAQFEEYEKSYEKFVKAIEQYEATVGELEEAQDTLVDRKNERFDQSLTEIEMSVDLDISLAEDAIKTLEWQIKNLGDDWDSLQTKITNYGSMFEKEMGNIATYKKGITDILGLTLEDEKDVDALLNDPQQLETLLAGKELTAQQIEQLRSYRDGLMASIDSIKEMRNTVQDELIEAFEASNEKMEDQLTTMDRLSSTMDNYRNIIDLVGKKNLGVSNDLIAKMNQANVDNANEALRASRTILEANKQSLADAEAQLEAARTEGNKENIEFWEETVKIISDTVAESEKEVFSRWQTALQKAADAYADAVDAVMETFESAMAGVSGSFDALSEKYSQQSTIRERYLADYEKIYNLSKLTRDIESSVNETDSIRAKNKLLEIQEEITALQESGAEMTQYEVDELRAKYELRLAEIALEDAQNAKSQVRMRRDSEGNWSYVYTADEDKVAEAKQNVEDKLYAYQELTQNRIDEMSEQMVNLPKEYADAIRAIANDMTLTEEERAKRMEETTEFYRSQYEYLGQQLGIAIDDANGLYTTDWKNYADATGYKISEDNKWQDKFGETLAAQVTGYKDLTTIQDAFQSSTETMLSSLGIAYGTYKTNVDTAMSEAGTSVSGFAGTVDKKTEEIKKDTEAAGKEITDLAKDGQKGFKGLVDAAVEWLDDYQTSFQPYIDENKRWIESIGDIINEYAKLDASLTPVKNSLDEIIEKQAKAGTVTVVDGNKDDDDGDKEEDEESVYVAGKTSVLGKGTTATLTKSSIKDIWFDSRTGNAKVDYINEHGGTSTILLDEQAYNKVIDRLGYTNATVLTNTKSITIANNSKNFKGTDGNIYATDIKGKTVVDVNRLFTDDIIKIGNPSSDSITYIVPEDLVKNISEILPSSSGANPGLSNASAKNSEFFRVSAYDTGGYTGSWDSSGRLAMLHQKEIVLNAHDTENFLSAINIVRDIASMIDLRAAAQQSALSMMAATTAAPTTQTLQQEVTIHAEFPNATQRTEIEAAFDTLLNRASQFANRKK